MSPEITDMAWSMHQREPGFELESSMEQHDADLMVLARVDEPVVTQSSVSKRDIRREKPTATELTSEPVPARLDLLRKGMLGVACVLTLLWFCFLAWSAVWLIGTLFF
jgi:hypothetical protein